MRCLRGLSLILITVALCGTALCAEQGLVASYSFDEGSGRVVHDESGNGIDGVIYGARFAKNGSGHCLVFDGQSDYVDLGNRPPLNLNKECTLEAWVHPNGLPADEAEPAIFGKAISSFIVTYYGGGVYFYINEGANNLRMTMLPGSWHHVVATFNGDEMKLYQDGKLAAIRAISVENVAPGKDFYIGCQVGDARTDEGAKHALTQFFSGKMDDVRVYNLALRENAVKQRYLEGITKFNLLAEYKPALAVETIRQHDITVHVSKDGEVQVDDCRQTYLVDSTFSYPGEQIGWNAFSSDLEGSETDWTIKVAKLLRDYRVDGKRVEALEIEATGKFYAVHRVVEINEGKVEFRDRFTNLDQDPIGIEIWNGLKQSEAFLDSINPGGKALGANPSVFLAGKTGNMVVHMEDDLSRMRYQAALGAPANQARIRISDLALDVGKSVTLRWSMTPLPRTADYFAYLNQRRKDRGSNFTIEGSFQFLRLGAPIDDAMWMPWEDPERLKAFLQRKPLRIVAVIPFLDYDPGALDHVWPRDVYKQEMQKVIKALKSADPDIKMIGSIECDWIALHPENMEGGNLLPAARVGDPSNEKALTPEQTRVIEMSDLPWKDSMKRNAEGNASMELYVRGGKPQAALAVYPIIGNYQYEFLMDQVRFLLDDVGFDGFYIDQFAMVWSTIKTYGSWDGISAELDQSTGRISRKYFDANYAGISARVNLCKYALDRGKIVVANTYATSAEEETLPVYRFSEVWNAFDPMATTDGEKPPIVPYLYQGSLASPIALGLKDGRSKSDTARRTIKGVIGYLRHGLLYYHYHISDIPITGPGSGEYGPINHMFPITPVSLHEGWIEGEERTIACVSGIYDWKHERPPTICLFDLEGKQVEHQFKPEKSEDGWRVQLELKDWAQIAVIE